MSNNLLIGIIMGGSFVFFILTFIMFDTDIFDKQILSKPNNLKIGDEVVLLITPNCSVHMSVIDDKPLYSYEKCESESYYEKTWFKTESNRVLQWFSNYYEYGRCVDVIDNICITFDDFYQLQNRSNAKTEPYLGSKS